MLGRVLARRGDSVGAEAAFRAAAETARVARMPLVELIVARELERHVPGSEGRKVPGLGFLGWILEIPSAVRRSGEIPPR